MDSFQQHSDTSLAKTMPETLIQITDTNFDETVQNNRLPVLLDLWATWCKPCKAMKPVLEQVTKIYAESLLVAQADIDACKSISALLCVRSVPTLILFKDGAEIARTSGSMPYARLVSWLTKHGIASPPAGSDESSIAVQDDAVWSAFHGDGELKHFFYERVRKLAESGKIEGSRFPRWSQEGGSISAAFNKRADPRVFERTTGIPISAGLAMEFAFIASPEATAALFEAIHPGADLSQVAPRLMLAWLGDTNSLSAAFLGDTATDELRQDWAQTLRMMLAGESVPRSTWTSLHQRAHKIRQTLHVEKEIAKSAIEVLAGLCPPPDPDHAGPWLSVLNLHGTYIAILRPLFELGFTQHDFDLERIRHSFFRAATGGRRGTELSKQELDSIHDRWEAEHADDKARLEVVLETSRRMRKTEHARITSILIPIIAGSPLTVGLAADVAT